MYPILLCSITALAIFIERLWNLRWKHVIPRDFIGDVEQLIRREKFRRGSPLSTKPFFHGANPFGGDQKLWQKTGSY